MREALQQLRDGEYWTYGPSTQELDQVVELVQKYSDYADACIEQLTSDAPVSGEFSDAHAEVSSDLKYYNHIEKGLLWSYALWRIQGMFEALLVSHFLPSKPKKRLIGLGAKLQAISGAGYETDPDYKKELLDWGELRNLLSHMPPEHYSPIAVDREDIEEYVALLKTVCDSWTKQRQGVCGKKS